MNKSIVRIDTLFNGVANTFVVTTDNGVWVIDPGMTQQAGRILNKIRALGRSPEDVRLILLTHGHIDHAGSAAELKRLTGAPIAIAGSPSSRRTTRRSCSSSSSSTRG